jgi:hypothetical protein
VCKMMVKVLRDDGCVQHLVAMRVALYLGKGSSRYCFFAELY